MKIIYYFTQSYPYGYAEKWKENELNELVNHFDLVYVCPLNYGNSTKIKEFPKGIKVNLPFFRNIVLKWYKPFFLINSRILFYILEFCRKKVYKKKAWLISFLSSIYIIEKLKKNKVIKDALSNNKDEIIFYFYWGVGASYIAPFIKSKNIKIVVRYHGYDLYEDSQVNGYIPFRIQQLKRLDLAIFISTNGADFIKHKYPKINLKYIINRLGTISQCLTIPSHDNELRIFSCSLVYDLKRVNLIAEAIASITEIDVVWTHLGNGELFDDLKKYAQNFFPVNIKYYFPGWVEPSDIFSFYKNKQVDLFINVSKMEGIPVSIMEAISAGIPIIATNVGAVNEIVDNTIGKLLSPDISKDDLKNEILKFYKLPASLKDTFRNNAFNRYEKLYNAEKNAKALTKSLISLFN